MQIRCSETWFSPLILVTGAAGALGRLVVTELVASGHNVVADTRHPDRAAPHLPAGVERRRVDFDDLASLRNGLRGVQRLLVISTDELGEPERRQRQHRAALDGVREAGATFIAYTSMPDPTHVASIPFAPDHVVTERDLAQGASPHAVLRNAWYQENLLGYLPWIIADGSWFHAAGDGRIPYVARADVARAAASAHANARPGIFDVAGPAALTV